MAAESLGRIGWKLTRDKEGHREYSLSTKIKTTSSLDGPTTVMACPGLSVIGAFWAQGNDLDPRAFCWPTMTISPFGKADRPHLFWKVDQTFSTKPLERCQDQSIENPLAEPQKLNGSFVRYVRETKTDRFFKAILSSSHEYITGIKIDACRPNVIVEQNVASLGLETFSEMVDTLNDAPLWGLPARKIKMSQPSWSRKLYGLCTYYYTRRFEFEVDFDGFDEEDILDTGFKVFDSERWPDNPANRANPEKYILVKDAKGENTPTKVALNGNGSQLTDPLNPEFIRNGAPVEIYGESNFLQLGIPVTL